MTQDSGLNKAEICSLEDITLSEHNETGGVDAMVKYIKSNVKVIKNRNKKYPVIIVLDWDAKQKENEIKRYFTDGDPIKVIVWEENNANPKLGKEFKGMERFLSDRIMNIIKNKHPEILMFNETTKKFVISSSYNELKDKVSKLIRKELQESDLEFAQHILDTLVNAIKGT
jgi:predicted RND superfamily exporter protein